MQPDTVVVNGKYRISITEPLKIDKPEWLERSLNMSTAVSNAVIQHLYTLLRLKEADGYGVGGHVWGAFQGVRKKFKTNEYFREQIIIIVMIDPETVARIYVRPVKESYDSVLAELEKIRNGLQLLEKIGDVELANLEYVAWREPGVKPKGKGVKPPYGNKGATSKPFAQLKSLGNKATDETPTAAAQEEHPLEESDDQEHQVDEELKRFFETLNEAQDESASE